MNTRSVSREEKLTAVKQYLTNKYSIAQLARVHGVSTTSFKKWINKYNTLGEKAFSKQVQRHRCTPELKSSIVNEYLGGNISFEQLAIKYKISSRETIRSWVMEYNGHKRSLTSTLRGEMTMNKGRNTTQEERLEIVEYCLNHDCNYAETAEKYHVSYTQANSWVWKYKKDGIEGLKDRRGHRKPLEEMTEIEKLKYENRLLKAEKKHQEMEIAFLKKLDEIERRRV